MQMRLLAAQANVEEKRIAELKARLKENLSLLDCERTCRELTRMQGELIKTSLFPKSRFPRSAARGFCHRKEQDEIKDIHLGLPKSD